MTGLVTRQASGSLLDIPNTVWSPNLLVNNWYAGTFISGPPALASFAVNVNYGGCTPFYIRQACTINALMVSLSNAQNGGVQGAIYATNARGLPTGSPIATTSVVSITTSTKGPSVTLPLSSNVSLPVGMYWFVLTTNSAGPSFGAYNYGAAIANTWGSATEANVGYGALFYYMSGATNNTFPANPTLTEATNTANYYSPILGYQVYSIP